MRIVGSGDDAVMVAGGSECGTEAAEAEATITVSETWTLGPWKDGRRMWICGKESVIAALVKAVLPNGSIPWEVRDPFTGRIWAGEPHSGPMTHAEATRLCDTALRSFGATYTNSP